MNVDVEQVPFGWRNGVVLMNSGGGRGVYLAASLECRFDYGTEFAEAMDVFRGMQLAIEHNFLVLSVESDSEIVIKAINGHVLNNSYPMPLVQ